MFLAMKSAALGRGTMSHSNLTHWIEDADAREICRDATFLTGVEQKQYLHLGAVIAKVSDWWHHSTTETVLPVPRDELAGSH
jgi:hypothetical protein